jgi:hypothetical protein
MGPSSPVLSDQQFAVGRALVGSVILQEGMHAPYERAKIQQTPPTQGDLRGLLDALSCVGNNARGLYQHRVL